MKKAVFVVAFVACLSAGSHFTICQAAAFGTNLVVNGDAEAGAGSPTGATVAVPGWTTVGAFTAAQYGASGGFPTLADPGPASRGLNFFAGGPDNPSSSASQIIDVSANDAVIDLGGVKFSLAAFLGGFDGQGDNAILTATFRNASNSVLGSATLGPVTLADRGGITGLLSRSTAGDVPIGTRNINVNLQMTRLDGAYNDGYADNLSLILNAPVVTSPEPATFVLWLLACGVAILGGRAFPSRPRLAHP